MFYFVKTSWWLKKIYSDRIWKIPDSNKVLYLTFDDGPNELVTPFVLNSLAKYNAKATFFCIGKNVVANSELYQRILTEGHTIGNHTFNHLNGWKTKDSIYIQNIFETKKIIDSTLFRPPYGRMTQSQCRLLMKADGRFKIIMWSVLSGDFDVDLSPEKCLMNVIKNAGNGSIIVFHDSEKAFSNLKFALPEVLKYFSEKGYQFKSIKV